MNKIPVTVITVCRNHAKGLEKTIQSVESQTWQEKEYLVIDGASTDGTMEVIRQHEGSITQWISEPDLGIYDAMNKGVRLAQGQWIIFMNAGDTFASTEFFCFFLLRYPLAKKEDPSQNHNNKEKLYYCFYHRIQPL